MSEGNRRVGSGIAGLDQAIDQFRLGDNVVWQVDTIEKLSLCGGALCKTGPER